MKLRLTAVPEALERPGAVTVRWAVAGATAVVLSELGSVAAEGAFEPRLQATTTFVLTAFDRVRGRVACTQVTVPVRELVAHGVIVPWWGDANEVPDGWALCDGRNGTPDLRGRFVRGADRATVHSAGDGGTHSHVIAGEGVEAATESDGAHTHVAEGVAPRRWVAGRGGRRSSMSREWASGAHAHGVVVDIPEIVTTGADPLPPHQDLHYLMKR